jgi:hypothetical protein
MSNDLIPAGGGALVPASTGGAVGEHIGDVSLDRGTAPLSLEQQPAREADRIASELAPRLGIQLDARQKSIIAGWLGRSFERQITMRRQFDERERANVTKELRAKWGASYEGHIQWITDYLLDSFGNDVYEELLSARGLDGSAIMNKTAVLEALLKAAVMLKRLTGLAARRGGDTSQGAKPDMSARLRELESWMAAPRGTAEYKRYYGDPAVQAEYRELIGQGVTSDARHSTADSDVGRRIAEIEALMRARPGSADYKRYWNDPQIQREYAELLARRS